MVDDPAKTRVIKDGLVDFHYQKTSQYRGVHADGFWGGPTPRGTVAISFFAERQAIPRRAQRRVEASEGDTFDLGPEEPVEVLSGVVRQVETTIYMDLKTTQELYVWLGSHLAAMEVKLGLSPEERVAKDGA